MAAYGLDPNIPRFCLMQPWVGKGNYKGYMSFEEGLNTVLLVDSTTNTLLFCVVLGYMIVQLCRRTKMSWLNWLGLSQLAFVSLFVGWV